MTRLALLQMSAIAKNTQCIHSSRNSICSALPHTSRRTTLHLISRNNNLVRPRVRTTGVVQVHASQSPNPFGGGGGGKEGSSLIADLALPAGALALLLIAGPIFGGATAIFGLPVLVVGAAAAFGLLDAVAGFFGTTQLVAAGVVASSVFGLLLIPAFIKFGFIALAGYFVLNLLFGGGSSSDEDSDVTSGGGGSNSYYNNDYSSSSTRYRNRDSFDARDVTIDVEAESIDD
jgi:hypothetical protein